MKPSSLRASKQNTSFLSATLKNILTSSISHPHKKQTFQERGEQRNVNHHLENFHHVFSSWLLASLIGVYSFLGTTFLMESYAATTSTVPSQVTNLRGAPYTGGVLLAWNQATSPVSTTPVTDYIIGYKLSTSSIYKTYSDGSSTIPNTRVEPLISGNTYDFRVAARSKKGLGPYSTSLRITIPANLTTLPSAPTGVTATPKADTNPTTDSATISFITPRNNGGLPIKSYTITAYPKTTVTNTNTTNLTLGIITKTITATPSLSTANSTNQIKVSLTLTGLTNNTTYTFTVRATNSLGSSPESLPSAPIVVGKTTITPTNTGTTNTGTTTPPSPNTGTTQPTTPTTNTGTTSGSTGGTSPTPTPTPINGVCGNSNGQTLTSPPAINLCSTGTSSFLTTGTSSYTWSCMGSNGGITVSCSATRQVNSTLPTTPTQNSSTNFFSDSGFESGAGGFEPNQSNTVVSTTRTNPISGSQSLVIGIGGYGDSVLWSGVDFSGYTNKRSSLLSIAAHFRSTVSSTSKGSLCGLVNYTDGTSDTQCSEFNMSIGDKGMVTLSIPLVATKDLSLVRIGVFQVGSQVIAGLMMDDVQVNIAGLTLQNPTSTPVVSPSPTPNTPPSTSTTPVVSPTGYNPAGTATAPTTYLNGLRVDLSYVNQSSVEFSRFKSMVDAALAGDPDYGFEPQHAAYMYRITSDVRYCDYAIRFAENCAGSRYAELNCGVEGAESQINSGNRPPVSGDSYLEVGPTISSLALVYDWCGSRLTTAQKTRWQNYANQAIFNVWNPDAARWGGVSYPWSGWSINNPGNNYYYSFVEATMYWALATKNQNMLAYVRTKLQGLVDYYRLIPGGGSLEGTGYGASHMRLFQIYQVWKDSTGEDLANATTHLTDTIRFWLHATTPNRAYYAPIGDLARASFPDLFDYHRRIVLEARKLTLSTLSQDIASWWLNHISVNQMSRRIDSQWDLLPAGTNMSTTPNEPLTYHATGVGRIFARTGWDNNALWMTFVAGKYNESHAHQDQGSFDLANNTWLAVTNNIYSPSGIEQGSEYHNVLRFEQNGTIVPQREGTESVLTVNQLLNNGDVDATANLTPAYAGSSAIGNWTRNIKFAQRKLTVNDTFNLGAGTRAIFQVHVPVQPVISGNLITAGTLKIRVLSPANPVITVTNLGRYRIDISGGTTGYIVELTDQ